MQLDLKYVLCIVIGYYNGTKHHENQTDVVSDAKKKG